MATSREPLLLHLLIMNADNLMKKDLFGMCDPYVKVSLRRDKKVYSKTTKQMKKTRSPEWNEKLEFKDINKEKDLVLFEVFDANRLTRDNFLGRVIIKLSQFPVEKRKVDILNHVAPMKFDLRGRSAKSHITGTIKIKFLYYNEPDAPPLPPRGANRPPSSGLRRPNQQDLGSLVQGARGLSVSNTGRPLPPTPTSPNPTPTTPTSLGGISRQTTIAGNEWTTVADEEEPLPQGWEERTDANGRVFYIDHSNHRTQWERPRTTGAEMREQVQLERRRQFQHTMRRRIPTSNDSNGQSGDSPSQQSLSVRRDQPSPRSNTLTESPVARPRPVSTSGPQRPVSAIDQRPSNDENDLPPGWEMRVASNGRRFYVNHSTRKTTWEHPRLRTGSVSPTPSPGLVSPSQPARLPQQPLPQQPSPQQPSPQPQQPQQSVVTPVTPDNTASNGDLGPMPPGWEVRTLQDGRLFFIDHHTHSTQWEDPRKQQQTTNKSKNSAMPAYDRDYKRKYEAFQKNLAAKKPENLPRMFEIPVRRDHLFEDSHRAIMSLKNKELMKCRLWVKFSGETGLDYGGLSREWFFLLSHEMLNPYYGLFEYAASDNYTLQINPDSGVLNENHLDYFRFIGRVFAMAVYHKKLIDAFFIRPFYKMLLSKSVTLSDMESVDTEFYNSIKYILENDPEPLCLTFTASREFLGQVEEIELKPNGGEIDITEDNKKEYIKLLIKWRFEERVFKQMEAVKKGFNDLIPLSMMKMFDERELEYLMCGLADINVEDWKKNSIYHNGYTAQDQVIIWFWKAVENMDSENRARLLQFVTGTSKVPMNGFAEIQGSNGPQKFCIKKLGGPDALPRSHTCFNRIDLPPYRSYHELKEKLKLAIENTEGFEGVD